MFNFVGLSFFFFYIPVGVRFTQFFNKLLLKGTLFYIYYHCSVLGEIFTSDETVE